MTLRPLELDLNVSFSTPAFVDRTVDSGPIPDAPAPSRLTRGDVVAGANEGAEGIILSWAGAGRLPRTELVAALESAGLPADWAPKNKSTRNHASTAIESLTGTGYVVRSERGISAAQRNYSARWIVGTVGSLTTYGAAMVPGDPMGDIAITFTLTDESLGFQATDVETGRAESIVANFRTRMATEMYEAAEITEWLRDTLRTHCGAVPFGACWYVRRRSREDAERLCEALSTRGWGRDWMLPAIPVANSEQLLDGIYRGLQNEIHALVEDWNAQVSTARAAGRTVGHRAAATLQKKLVVLSERARDYERVLGDYRFGPVRDRVASLAAAVRPYLSDTALRGAQLELD